jgi:hypothetical protein
MRVSKQAKEFADLILQYYGCSEKAACQRSACPQHGEGHSHKAAHTKATLEPSQSDHLEHEMNSGSTSKLQTKPSASTEFGKWESISKTIEDEEKKSDETKESEKNQIWGCAQDHRKERDIYERPNSEKMSIAGDFKKQGDTAFKEQRMEEADYCYQKVT